MTAPSDAFPASPLVVSAPSRVRWALCAVASLPFATAFGAAWLPTRPAEVAETAHRSPLVFEQYLVNLGPVPAMREVVARYTFKNVGPHPIHISELQPSCGCLNPRLEKRDYAPGETGAFHLRVQTAAQNSGPQDFTVRVTMEERPESGPPTTGAPVELAFKMILPEKQVSIRPRALAFYQLGSEPTSQDVSIVDDRGKGLTIVDVVASSPFVKAAVVKSETQGNTTEHTLRVTVAAAVPAGRMRGLITVRTTDPAYRTLQVPLIIQGPEKQPLAAESKLKVEPAEISFRGSAGFATAPLDVTVTGQPGQSLAVLETRSSTGMVSASVLNAESDGDGRPVVTLRVHLTGGQEASAKRDLLTVRTNDPAQPQFQIPVMVASPIRRTSASSDDGPR